MDIDAEMLKQQRALLLNRQNTTPPFSFSPLSHFESSGNREDQTKGLQLIKSGKTGCILLAGGQGTRLGFPGQKGCSQFPLKTKRPYFKYLSRGFNLFKKMWADIANCDHDLT